MTGGEPGATGSEPGMTGGEAGAAGTGSWELRALTFNTALAPTFEPFSSERAPAVVSALAQAANQLDVMCVQEFWLSSDFTSLVDATKHTLPNVLHAEPRPGSGSCTVDQLGSLAACQNTKCEGLNGGDLAGCLQAECADVIQALPGGCLGCLFDHLDDAASCAGAGGAPSDPAIFGGDSDIGLLSRYPLLNTEVLPLDAYFQRGAVLYGKVAVPELGAVHVFCTHLSSSLGVIPYAGPDGSWDSEHLHEVAQLVDFIHDKSRDSAPVVVFGDLNMGLALNGNPAVLKSDFDLLLAAGLRDPYLDAGMPACSECSDNSFRGANSTDDLIDHIMLRGFPDSRSVIERAFTAPVTIQSGTEQVLTNLSDHYGLRLELKPR